MSMSIFGMFMNSNGATNTKKNLLMELCPALVKTLKELTQEALKCLYVMALPDLSVKWAI